MKRGYNIFQINLNDPQYSHEWVCGAMVWTMLELDAEHICNWLNEKYEGLHFFITKGS